MEKHGTTPVSGWYVEFQMAVLRALPRDITQEVAEDWRQNGEALAKNLRSTLVSPEPASILNLLSRGESLVLDVVDGTETLANATDIFAYIDSDFRNWGTDRKGPATKETNVAVYEMVKDATFSQMFGSLSSDLNNLCLTQAQIINFVKKYRRWLHTDGYATFFLFESGGGFFVASVDLDSGGGLGVLVRRLENSNVWNAGIRHRLVLPKPLFLSPVTGESFTLYSFYPPANHFSDFLQFFLQNKIFFII